MCKNDTANHYVNLWHRIISIEIYKYLENEVSQMSELLQLWDGVYLDHGGENHF